MRIALLGAPGSGKDTQAKQVAQKHGIPVIVTAELVREVIAADTPLGQQAKAATETGTLPDDILFPIIRERLSRDDTGNGFLFSGFPRTAAQAESLDNLLNELGQPLQAALLIQVDPEMLIERLTGRRTCISCGAAFNIYTSPSRLGDICDKCGGNLRHRADDNEETITNRIRAFEAQTKPLVEFYRQQGRIRVVQGMGEIRDIAKAIDKVIRNLPEVPVAPVVEEATAESKSEVTLTDLANKVAEAAKMAREDDTKTVGGGAAPKKAAPKKAAPKKAAPKKAAPKKAAPKKAAPKKAAPKKAAPKKAAPKKAAPKKAAPKKAAPKKAAPKKAAPKKAAPKKAAPKKAAPKKAAPKKAAPKKAAPKKAAPKKAAPKKAAPKKAAPKKAAPKKAAPKKAAPKKAAPKKAAPKKAAPKKAAPKKAAPKKAAPKKAAPKKAAPKKAAPKKAAPKKAAPKKAAPKKAAPKKAAPKKAAPKKAAPKKAAPKKAAPKKAAPKKAAPKKAAPKKAAPKKAAPKKAAPKKAAPKKAAPKRR